jgi:DNA-directed RNA polymerase II subunit RPB4
MKKTQDYLTSFARFNSKEAIHAVERVLRNDPDLHKFEVAQLGSLCPEEAEEAKTLIPRYIGR